MYNQAYQQWYRNQPENKKKQREYIRLYNEVPEHKEKKRLSRKTPRNKELKKLWYKSEKGKAYIRSRYKNELNYRIALVLRNRLNRVIRKNWKTGSAIRDLGCSVDDFKNYIANQFREGMSWENWGEWHLDHKQPLNSFDLTQREEHIKAFHYTNYQPLWAIENLRKGNKNV